MALVVCVVTLAGLAPAQAVVVEPLSKGKLAQLGIKKSEIPRWLSESPQRNVGYGSGHAASRPLVCELKSGNNLRGARPANSSKATVRLAKNRPQFAKKVKSFLYQYGSTQQALGAFRAMQRQAHRCEYRKRKNVDDDGTSVKVRVHGKHRESHKLGRVRGFAINTDVRVNVAVPDGFNMNLLVDKHSAFHLSGQTIVRVEYTQVRNRPGTPRLGGRKARFVNQKTTTIASRVWRAAT